jgi:SAM-dependent methyltransferase
MRRVGTPRENPEADYLKIGALERSVLLEYLPDSDWLFAGRRVLDFGSGAGGAIRHFDLEAKKGVEFWGCDIHEPSITWAQRNLPQFTFFQNAEVPPLNVPDEHFDLIYAFSVFTHITSYWADWLIELRRVLRPDGMLIASVLGQAMYESLLAEPYTEDRVGMMVLKPGLSWDMGGPLVFHSKWWLKAHWSPAIEIVTIDENVAGRRPDAGHDLVVGRRAPDPPSRQAMVAPVAGEPREAIASMENARRLCIESEQLRK